MLILVVEILKNKSHWSNSSSIIAQSDFSAVNIPLLGCKIARTKRAFSATHWPVVIAGTLSAPST